jgi:hypothetical protein
VHERNQIMLTDEWNRTWVVDWSMPKQEPMEHVGLVAPAVGADDSKL